MLEIAGDRARQAQGQSVVRRSPTAKHIWPLATTMRTRSITRALDCVAERAVTVKPGPLMVMVATPPTGDPDAHLAPRHGTLLSMRLP